MRTLAAPDDGVWQRMKLGSTAGSRDGVAPADAGPNSGTGSPLTATDVGQPAPPSTSAHGTRSGHDGMNAFIMPSTPVEEECGQPRHIARRDANVAQHEFAVDRRSFLRQQVPIKLRIKSKAIGGLQGRVVGTPGW